MQTCRQLEARKQNRDLVRTGTLDSVKTVDYVKSYAKKTDSYNHSKQPTTPSSSGSCRWCGHAKHDRSKCPARDAICNRCSKKGHYGAVCKSSPASSGSARQAINEVEDVEMSTFHSWEKYLPGGLVRRRSTGARRSRWTNTQRTSSWTRERR